MMQVPRWRVFAVFLLLATCLGTLAVKAGRLQLILGDDLRGLAENQYLRKVQLAAPRGDITDRHGRPMAVSVLAWSVSARPAAVEDKEGAAEALAKTLDLNLSDVRAKLNGTQKFVWLKRRASGEMADAVRALAIPGIELKQEMRRVWPQKSAAGQLLGNVDVDGKPRGGIELAFDESLAGRADSVAALADNKGDRIALPGDLGGGPLDLKTLEGDDVALTIDLAVQHEAEEALWAAITENDAKAGWALALDAQTGAILAVANAPAYNPNDADPRHARNRAFAEAFEPGSTFKIATFAAALDAGVIAPSDRIFCENGRYQVGKHIIHDTHKAEWLTVTEVFQQSSNIGTLKIAQRVGEDRMKEAIARFGFGARPGTGLKDEASGRIPSASRWGDARLATISFGHGVLVSALQLASFLQGIANDGVRKVPYILHEATSATGEVARTAAEDDGARIMSADAARTLRTIMTSVAKEGGTGTLAAIPGIDIAGKTGTAEKVDPVTRRYSKTLHLSSFVGFAPADTPRIVAVVIIDEPKKQHFGGLVAAPAWRRIVERALVAQGVLGDAQIAGGRVDGGPAAAEGPAAPGATAARLALGPSAPFNTVHQRRHGEGAEPGNIASEEASVTDVAEPTAHAVPRVTTLPDLRGLSARAAVRAAEEVGLAIELQGSGVVVTQEPAPGKPVPQDRGVKLLLAHAAGTVR